MRSKEIDIQTNIDFFVKGYKKNKGRKSDERYSSFDYCFNYFQSFKSENRIAELNSDKNINMSCLQIGFYLASWGMLRNSYLLEKSVRFYKKLVDAITDADEQLWLIDVDNYLKDDNLGRLIDFRNRLKTVMMDGKIPSDTLITKIMLGVFGNVPAFDEYFRKGLGTHSFSNASLTRISAFYEGNKDEIDKLRFRTFDFVSGKHTHRRYTKAKIIDMIGFMEGLRNSEKSTNR